MINFLILHQLKHSNDVKTTKRVDQNIYDAYST
jgi:hypothetical protein